MLTLDQVETLAVACLLGRDTATRKHGLTPEAIAKGPAASVAARRTLALQRYARLAGPIQDLRRRGLTLREIANILNDADERTLNGFLWSPTQVSRVLALAQPGGHPR